MTLTTVRNPNSSPEYEVVRATMSADRKLKKENPTAYLVKILKESGEKLYEEFPGGYSALDRATDQLSGRTHYVDSNTLKFFGSRILSSRTFNFGLSFFIVESVYTDSDKKSRGFRAVEFDIYGTVINRTAKHYKNQAQAERAHFTETESFDIVKHYKEVFKEKSERALKEAAMFKKLSK